MPFATTKAYRTFLDEYLEDCSEENVFHLKATKTEQLTEMYGRRQSVLTMTASDTCSEAASRSRSETVSSSHTSSTHVSFTVSLTQNKTVLRVDNITRVDSPNYPVPANNWCSHRWEQDS